MTSRRRTLDRQALYSVKGQDRLTSRKGFVKPQVKEAYNNFQYKHIGYASVAGKMFGADLMALLGDIGLNSIPTTLDKNEAKKMIDNTFTKSGEDVFRKDIRCPN